MRLDGLDRGPAHEPVALLGDPPAVDLGVGLAVPGCHPGPGAQLLGAGEPGDVADLGDEHRRQDWSDAVDGLDGLPAKVAGQAASARLRRSRRLVRPCWRGLPSTRRVIG